MTDEKYYSLEVDAAFHKLSTSINGLSASEAKERLETFGYNSLEEAKGAHPLLIFLKQFQNPLIYILMAAGGITLFLADYIDAVVIISVVFVNAVIGVVQEYKAEKSIKKLASMITPKSRILRDGQEVEVSSNEIVPGDIAILTSGMKVPADVRLFTVNELKIDESALTGESVPVEKQVEKIVGANILPGDQRNMAFAGTTVSTGRGRGVVINTGYQTELGKISTEMKQAEGVKTPLLDRIERLSRKIGVIVILISAIVIFFGIYIGENITEMLYNAVALAVGVIPEGLPAIVSITLAVGVNRMARQRAIIRKLPAVETLGSATVIASDKTGTLTKNEMTVNRIYTIERVYEVTGIGYYPEGSFLTGGKEVEGRDVSLDLTLKIGMLCNETKVYREAESWRVDGDPTEGALLISGMKRGYDPEKITGEYPLLDAVPFESERGYMATLHDHKGEKLVFVKGAPEKIFDMFKSACHINGEIEACFSDHLLKEARILASEGLRVLAMAYKKVPSTTVEITHKDVEKGGLIFAGYQAMIDPPRPEAIEAVQQARKSGIRIIMITGDYATTARAIAEKMGIVDKGSDVLTGREIEGMTEDDLYRKVRDISVFARVTPQHKLRIVQALQKHGEIVAVTGDGVNDAPALKTAQIGVAMGATGTDVAKDASDMILTDDNFASIYRAVVEGRTVFDNIRKVTLFLIAPAIGLVMTVLAGLALKLPFPFHPIQLLWMNLVTNGLQDVALCFEKGEEGVETRPPRNPSEGILSNLVHRLVFTGVIMAIAVLGIFSWQLNNGATLGQARTIAVSTLICMQFFYAFMSRSEKRTVFSNNLLSNKFLLMTVSGAFIAQLLAIYHPAM
ncbi:cation-translocating P-type ATPase [[Eubacterium] cellulosolvens]